MKTEANTLNNSGYRGMTCRALGIISTALLFLTVFAQFIAGNAIGSLELFVAVPLIAVIGVLVISDIAWAWEDSKILAIAGFVGSVILLAMYSVLIPVTGSVLMLSFYTWIVSVVVRFVSVCLDSRKLSD